MNAMDQFAIADIVIVSIILVSAMFGIMRGFVKEVVSLCVWSAAFVLSFSFGAALGDVMAENLDERPQTAIGFAAIFVVVLVAGAILQRILHGLVQSTGLSGTDRTLGLVFGGARGLAVVVLGLIFMRSFAEGSDWWSASQLAGPLLVLEDDVLAIANAIRDSFPGFIERNETPAEAV